MDRRRLGRTGIEVSPIGFGAFKLGRNTGIKYPHGYELPDERGVERVLNGVLDMGINYVDTAPAYGVSEERLGRALAGRRDEVVLSTKVGETFQDGRSSYDFSATGVRTSIEQSLVRLRTDVIDVVFIHSDGDDLRILQETDAVDALAKLRDDGLVRAIGMSTRTVQGARAAMAWSDVLMVEYHLQDRSHADVIAEAARADIGIVIKKGLASGHLVPQEAIRFVLATEGVGSLVVGSLSLEHLRENVRVAVVRSTER